MFLKFFLLFVIFPVIELAILIKIGIIIGVFNAIVLIIFTALIGSYMVKMEGLNVFYRFQENLSRGIFPSEDIFDGILILIAGALLITPGVLTDLTGFLFVFPTSRGKIKVWIKKYIGSKIDSSGTHISFTGH